jgi:autophagy-related protein 11
MNKRRPAPRKVSALSDPETERKTGSEPPESPSSKPPAPPQSEFESVFSATQPPTSSSFPVRARANSTPVAGPSSLSRLLAQAPSEQLETIAPSRDVSPPASSPPPPAPSSPSTQQVDLNAQQSESLPRAPHVPSPLRPGSRGSRASSSSRFSAARLPRLISVATSPPVVKAVAATAIAEHSLSSSPNEFSATRASSPSQDSVFDGKSIFHQRHRTISHHIPRSSPLAGDNPPSTPHVSATSALANYFAVPFGRRKKVEMPVPIVEAEQMGINPGQVKCQCAIC